MMRVPILAVAALLGAGVLPLAAQKPPPRAAVRPPASAPPPGKTLQPGTGAAQGAPTVTPQAARPSGAAGTNTFTAGLAMPDFAGGSADAALEYATRFGRMLDSAVVFLVDIFRNTSGQPMVGAGSPAALSQRERDRWSRCRNVYWDLTTYAGAVHTLKPSLPPDQEVQQAAAALDTALAALASPTGSPVAQCDNLASMIAAPDRWTPWQDQYEAAARHFYRDFYAQVRAAHERDRAFVNAVNAALPPGRRIPVPPGLPPNPPYAGATPGE